MAYQAGNNTQIIVGAAAFFHGTGPLVDIESNPLDVDDKVRLPFDPDNSYKDTLEDGTNVTTQIQTDTFTNVGYTSNGLELMFEPDFGEVSVDQVLDVAKLYKQGMKVSMKTSFAEATLENLLVSIASNEVLAGSVNSAGRSLNLSAGTIGECPIERGLIAVGPGTGECAEGTYIERVYIAYRALSIESVTVSAKRDEPSAFEVSFRLLPSDTGSSYGKIVDRSWIPLP
jgi:hypothetical protein